MIDDFIDRLVQGSELLDNDFIPNGLFMSKVIDGTEYRFEPVAPGWYSYAGQKELTEVENEQR